MKKQWIKTNYGFKDNFGSMIFYIKEWSEDYKWGIEIRGDTLFEGGADYGFKTKKAMVNFCKEYIKNN